MHAATVSSAHIQEVPFRANKAERLQDELELVSYVTSHDLQAPLRVIQSCCEELRNHSSLGADATASDVIKMLDREALHLKELMQGMLDDVRLEIFDVTHAALDTNELLQTALTTLAEEIKSTGAIIMYDALPQVMGHRGRLTRLLAHLLDNALKFRGEQPPRIHISARNVANGWEFSIKDNGIGIDEEFHDVIFHLFHRLHAGSTYAGNGIGLALARKIAASHGGSLKLESRLREGSRFYFTLPAVTEKI